MPLQRLQEQYPQLTNFLSGHFHQDAFYEHEFALTMNDLIDSVLGNVFINKQGDIPHAIEELLKEMDNFIHSLIYESYKIRYVEERVHTDFGGLEPLEFVRYLYYRLKIEINEQKLLREREEGGENL